MDQQQEVSFLIKDAKKVIGLNTMAYKDYIAARSLLLSGFLHQSVFFINTCIEKVLKAYLFIKRVDATSTHETQKLLSKISLLENSEWTKEINTEFIQVISKIYKSRYFENLGPGFNFVINRNKFLAELDCTYSLIESKIRLTGQGPEVFKSRFQIAKDTDDPLVYLNNYLLNKITKENFLSEPDMVYEFRIADTHHPLQGEYIIPRNLELKKFNYEGLKQKDNQNFIMSQWIEGAPESKMISFINSRF